VDSEYLSVDELKDIGFSHVGNECQISRRCSFHRVRGWIGDHVRVDDFCTIKGEVELCDYCHVCGYVLISGAHARVKVGEFTALSARTSVYSGSDDCGADMLGGSDTHNVYRKMHRGPVTFGVGAFIGAHSVILPNVQIGHGASVGASCVVWKNVPPGGVVRNEATRVTERTRNWQRILDFAMRVLDKTC
jgi:dTDP-4-amino-4,6-dideoxy-D-glucose acyltransferase